MAQYPGTRMADIFFDFPLANLRIAADSQAGGDPANTLTGLRLQEDASLKAAPGPKTSVQA